MRAGFISVAVCAAALSPMAFPPSASAWGQPTIVAKDSSYFSVTASKPFEFSSFRRRGRVEGYCLIYIVGTGRATHGVDALAAWVRWSHKSTAVRDLLGDTDHRLPAGRYTVAVLTDATQRVALPIGMRVRTGLTSVTPSVSRRSADSERAGALENGDVRTPLETVERLPLVYGLSRIAWTRSGPHTWDADVCVAGKQDSCDAGDPTYGYGNMENDSSGALTMSRYESLRSQLACDCDLVTEYEGTESVHIHTFVV